VHESRWIARLDEVGILLLQTDERIIMSFTVLERLDTIECIYESIISEVDFF